MFVVPRINHSLIDFVLIPIHRPRVLNTDPARGAKAMKRTTPLTIRRAPTLGPGIDYRRAPHGIIHYQAPYFPR